MINIEKKFEVQENCLFGGWTNTWTTYNEDGSEVPTIYDSFEDAVNELDEFFKDCEQAMAMGNTEDVPDREDFRIVEVKDE